MDVQVISFPQSPPSREAMYSEQLQSTNVACRWLTE